MVYLASRKVSLNDEWKGEKYADRNKMEKEALEWIERWSSMLLVMVLVPDILPLSLAAHLPVHDSLYDESPLVDYNILPYSGMRINDDLMNEPFQVDKRKNEFIRFGKRNGFMKFNKRKNEFIRFGKRSIKLKMF
ncbi:hypothetical protein LOAG_09821 [Loa loa]|uniref:Uncharacterized protein n=1 Tax=Loa loa TaxID=7209 RepID=A0A1S0TSN7_LOALO|nr:hypothetical protein LOAG_09821 [Loa loa]EFO18677.1 hypothetical protein LOAG_09821 [Loa loa]